MQNPRTDLPIVIKQAISLDTALIEATCKEVFEDDAQFLHMYGRARSRSEISSILRAWSFMQERLYIDVLSVDFDEENLRATVRSLEYARPKFINPFAGAFGLILKVFASFLFQLLPWHKADSEKVPVVKFDICTVFHLKKYESADGKLFYKIRAQEDYHLIDPLLQLVFAYLYLFTESFFGWIPFLSISSVAWMDRLFFWPRRTGAFGAALLGNLIWYFVPTRYQRRRDPYMILKK